MLRKEVWPQGFGGCFICHSFCAILTILRNAGAVIIRIRPSAGRAIIASLLIEGQQCCEPTFYAHFTKYMLCSMEYGVNTRSYLHGLIYFQVTGKRFRILSIGLFWFFVVHISKLLMDFHTYP